MTASETTPYLYTATCMFGLEGLLGEEIDALGYTRETTMDGRIHFRGDTAACARANIGLRYAERLYVTLGSFEARTFDELFEGTKALPWEDFIGRNDVFPVTGHAIKSALFSVPDCQRIIKKAVSVRRSAPQARLSSGNGHSADSGNTCRRDGEDDPSARGCAFVGSLLRIRYDPH